MKKLFFISLFCIFYTTTNLSANTFKGVKTFIKDTGLIHTQTTFVFHNDSKPGIAWGLEVDKKFVFELGITKPGHFIIFAYDLIKTDPLNSPLNLSLGIFTGFDSTKKTEKYGRIEIKTDKTNFIYGISFKPFVLLYKYFGFFIDAKIGISSIATAKYSAKSNLGNIKSKKIDEIKSNDNKILFFYSLETGFMF